MPSSLFGGNAEQRKRKSVRQGCTMKEPENLVATMRSELKLKLALLLFLLLFYFSISDCEIRKLNVKKVAIKHKKHTMENAKTPWNKEKNNNNIEIAAELLSADGAHITDSVVTIHKTLGYTVSIKEKNRNWQCRNSISYIDYITIAISAMKMDRKSTERYEWERVRSEILWHTRYNST